MDDPHDFHLDVTHGIAAEKKRVAAAHGMSIAEVESAASAALQSKPFLRVVTSESEEADT